MFPLLIQKKNLDYEDKTHDTWDLKIQKLGSQVEALIQLLARLEPLAQDEESSKQGEEFYKELYIHSPMTRQQDAQWQYLPGEKGMRD